MEMESLNEWDRFYMNPSAAGKAPSKNAVKRVLEYQTTKALTLLISRGDEKLAPAKAPQMMNVEKQQKDKKDSKHAAPTTPRDSQSQAKLGGTPEKVHSGGSDRSLVESENLGGMCAGKLVWLRDAPSCTRLLDDDKKKGVSQQLLTDMFAMMSVSKKK
jgi:hypothetical protein